MAETLEKNELKPTVSVRVSDDEMTAYIFLAFPALGQVTAMDQVEAALEKSRVTVGIRWDDIKKLVLEQKYGREITAAEGQAAVDGMDGYFEYLFPVNTNTRPRILSDGSVDYSSLGEVAVVEQGTEIVLYHPPVKGVNGFNVRGRTIAGRNGRELQPLKGKGFLLSEDKTSYVAAITGKVEYDGDNRRLMVSNLFVVNGDVSHVTGNVQFAGDIHIKGNIVTGMFVKAYGHIIVDGCVEAAHLIAGKDVTLKNGMQGSGKGIIEAGGNVFGKFFEQATIRAKGSVNANAIMNCDILAGECVLVSGKLGIIVGGTVSAVKEVEATLIGNMNEIKTKVIAGVDGDLFIQLSKLQEEITAASDELQKYKEGIQRLDEIIKKTKRADLNEKKMQLLRAKIEKDSNLAGMQTQKAEILEKMEKSTYSRIIVRKTIHPGVMLNINGVCNLLTTQNYNVTYTKKGAELAFVPNI